MAELILTDQNFDSEALRERSVPGLVDFWAVWCAPCRIQGPIVEELAKTYEGKAKIGKLDVDANPIIAQRYQVLSIPTSMIFKNGQVVWQGIGVQSKEKLVAALENALE